MLEVQNITKTFGQGDTAVKAVNNVSLKLREGETVFVMGPSGSGKTTLLTMLGLLLKPTEGKVFFKNENITFFSPNQLARIRLTSLGFIFQNFQLLSSLTALENVEIVLKLAGHKGATARQKSKDILAHLGLGKRLHHLPDKLSGGEKQRVAIARALVNDPVIILADEPTANLDSHNGHLVTKMLQSLVQEGNKCLVVVTHDDRIKDIADRILLMEDGVLQKSSSPEEAVQ